MVQHANNIEKADLDYSVDIFEEVSGGDLNSNSVVASVLHSVGLNLSTSLPDGVSRSDAPLYGQLQYMNVDDALFGTANSDRILGGVGNDRLYGRDGNDRLYGEDGNDRLYGSDGNDALFGGTATTVWTATPATMLSMAEAAMTASMAGSETMTLQRWSGNDRLYGESGADLFAAAPDRTPSSTIRLRWPSRRRYDSGLLGCQ